jgi:hypothetical protein
VVLRRVLAELARRTRAQIFIVVEECLRHHY